MGAAAAAVMIKERRIVEAMELAGATDPSHARSIDDLGVDAHGIGWRRLRDRAIVRESQPGSGLYYLDREVWVAVRRTRLRLVLALIVVVLAVLIVMLLQRPR